MYHPLGYFADSQPPCPICPAVDQHAGHINTPTAACWWLPPQVSGANEQTCRGRYHVTFTSLQKMVLRGENQSKITWFQVNLCHFRQTNHRFPRPSVCLLERALIWTNGAYMVSMAYRLLHSRRSQVSLCKINAYMSDKKTMFACLGCL